MRKPTFYICGNKGANFEADQRLCFTTRIVEFLYFLNLKFPALYSSVCVGPVRKPHCWFAHHKGAHMRDIMREPIYEISSRLVRQNLNCTTVIRAYK